MVLGVKGLYDVSIVRIVFLSNYHTDILHIYT